MKREGLVERLNNLVSRERDEYEKTMAFVKEFKSLNIEQKSMVSYLESTRANLDGVVNSLDNLSNHQIIPLLDAIEDDIDNIAFMRDSFVGKPVEIPENKIRRLPRKKLKYWQSQLNSSNPYIAYVANAKVTAHKMRVRQGVQSRKENEQRQKNKAGK